MRGYIYNNSHLADEGDGFWSFLGDKKPHEYWCVLREMEDDLVLLAPVFFDLMDNLPNSVIETCPIQMTEGNMNITVGVGRCIHREKSQLTTEVVIFMNPEMAKKAYNVVARMCRGE